MGLPRKVVFFGEEDARNAPVFPDAFAVIHRILSIKFRVAPAVTNRGRYMMLMSLYGVPNHCNIFPLGAQEALGFDPVFWQGQGTIVDDARYVISLLPDHPTTLIGFGYGGLVCWYASLLCPAKVEKLILIGTIPSPKHIPMRLRLLLLFCPKFVLLRWRDKNALSRLYSIVQGIPRKSPSISTDWYLSKNDPFHNWRASDLPDWSAVTFEFYEEASSWDEILRGNELKFS